MQRSINNLIGYTIKAKDGELGKVSEFYFDDHSWVIRYVVVETGSWFSERKVLIPHAALGITDWASETFQVNLTMEQVRNSPETDTHKTVSRQHEVELFQYYVLPIYWGDVFYSGPLGMVPVTSVNELDRVASDTKPSHVQHNDPNLRSSSMVKGYNIHAIDGEIGHLEDYIIDDENWIIKYLVIDTTNWLPGRKALIKPIWIYRIDWNESKVFVNLTMEAIKSSPEFDPTEPIGQNYEGLLFNHYGEPVNRY